MVNLGECNWLEEFLKAAKISGSATCRKDSVSSTIHLPPSTCIKNMNCQPHSDKMRDLGGFLTLPITGNLRMYVLMRAPSCSLLFCAQSYFWHPGWCRIWKLGLGLLQSRACPWSTPLRSVCPCPLGFWRLNPTYNCDPIFPTCSTQLIVLGQGRCSVDVYIKQWIRRWG